MSYSNKKLLTDVEGKPIPQYYDPETDSFMPMTNKVLIENFPETQNVQLMESIMTHYGATIAQRPEANTAPVGAMFMAVDSQEVWQSNGSAWVVVV